MDKILFNGQEVKTFTLKNEHIALICSNYGAKIISIKLQKNIDSYLEIVGGYDQMSQYLGGKQSFGAICGQYANRIAKGKFSLGGKSFQCDQNNNEHCLHGGKEGLYRLMWDVIDCDDQNIHFRILLEDGHMGFPGNVAIDFYIKLDDHTIQLNYTATTDADTIINIATHSYFNLNGFGDILNHKLLLNSDCITPIDNTCIPTGEYYLVDSTPFDFRESKHIGKEINVKDEQLIFGNGYDHNFVLDKRHSSELAAELIGDISNLRMRLYCSQPGLQFYTCNWPGSEIEIGKKHQEYKRHSFVCLEPQHYPDSPNQKHFPNTILRKNEVYSHWVKYEFDWLK
jgi:aldose 1-epimerase